MFTLQAGAQYAVAVAIRTRDGIPSAELGDDKANALLTPNGGRGGIGHGAVLAFMAKDACDDVGEISPTLRGGSFKHSHANGGVMPAVAFHQNDREEVRLSDTAYTLNSSGGGRPGIGYAAIFTSDGEVADPIQANEQRTYTQEGVTYRLRNCVTRFNANLGTHGGGVYEDASPVLRAGEHTNFSGVASTSMVRRLTPRECERLQGFPDDFTAVPFRGKAAADGPRYKALGNSMAVPVVRWVGKRIQMVEEK
jgi:DNA (cytosine-5)-methyltransferase 1